MKSIKLNLILVALTALFSTVAYAGDVVKDTINACMCDGVLCIELPRKAPEPKDKNMKVIEIK